MPSTTSLMLRSAPQERVSKHARCRCNPAQSSRGAGEGLNRENANKKPLSRAGEGLLARGALRRVEDERAQFDAFARHRVGRGCRVGEAGMRSEERRVGKEWRWEC